ncbi:unnamed protein product [Parajaminaea phylloscopi]
MASGPPGWPRGPTVVTATATVAFSASPGHPAAFTIQLRTARHPASKCRPCHGNRRVTSRLLSASRGFQRH